MNYADQSPEHLLEIADAFAREREEQRAQTVLLFALVKATMATTAAVQLRQPR